MLTIKEIRRRKKWTQEQLANEADVSQSMLSSIERGERTPSLDMLRKIATALGVDISTLLTREEGGVLSFGEFIEILSEKSKLATDDQRKLERIEAALLLLKREYEDLEEKH